MKRQAIFLAVLLAVAVGLGPGTARASDDGGMVAGAGAGVFPPGTSFAGLSLSNLQFGQGVFTGPGDGSASGVFHAVLLGSSALGQPQRVTVEGNVDVGSIAGTTSFSGIATVDMGNGSLGLPGVPFSVSVSPDSLQLSLGTTSLPAAVLSTGAIAIE
jgi:hypothetical protein